MCSAVFVPSACLCVLQAPPLFVLEFLHRVLDVFVSYFGDVDEMVVKRNFSTVYQVCSVCAACV